MKANKSEHGQVLVLVILAIVAIFGFTALAVDGGSISNQRRSSQSAADAAALAAGMEFSNSGDESAAIAAGLAIAETNGYNNDGVTNTVRVITAPESGPYQGWPINANDKRKYFQVKIWVKLEPVFAQMVGINNEEVTSEAVAYAKPISVISTGNAVHCLSTTYDCLEMDGTTTVNVDGGNIFSNGDGSKHGNPGTVRTTGGGGIFINGEWVCTGCDANTVIPAAGKPTGGAQLIKDPAVPYCPTTNEYDAAHGVNYYVHNGLSGSAVLQPGFHCFYGGIRLAGSEKLQGTGVVLVMMNGGISVTGQAAMELSRPNSIIDKNGKQFGGLLIYAPRSNTSTFILGGTADSFFSGTILAPGGTCDMGGNSTGIGMHTNMICNDVKFHGTNAVNIVYNEDELFKVNAEIELVQ